jgi:uncharacterized protein YjbJ (UPF0337 family)
MQPRTVAVRAAASCRRRDGHGVARTAAGYPACSEALTDSKETDMSDGTVDEAKGRVKEAAGDLTGDQDLKNEGKVDRASGKVKDAVGGVADKAKDALDKD